MNYLKIHNKFIEYFKSTKPKDRIKKRNNNDERLLLDSVYTELHHILPRSLGGDNSSYNLVVVLPEEHIFLHMLRYKIYKTRQDMLAVRFCLNGFDSNESKLKNIYNNLILNKKIRIGYAWMRTHTQNFRKKVGWHTKEGRKSISESRKGTMVVKDFETGNVIGTVSTSHPKVISGEWVHHSKNRIVPEIERKMRSEMGTGVKNNNYSGVSDENILEYATIKSLEIGRILPYSTIIKLSLKDNLKFPKSLSKMRFNGGGIKGYTDEMIKRVPDLEYNPYFRSDEQKENISKAFKGKTKEEIYKISKMKKLKKEKRNVKN